jgi:threonine dehydrogenase-like Zn-dependent dehydrogenase
MMEHRTHPVKPVHKVSNRLDWQVVSVIEPLCIARHSLKQSEAKAGEHLVAIGAGPIGLLVVMAARQSGVHPIPVGIVESRLAFARNFGVCATINSSE